MKPDSLLKASGKPRFFADDMLGRLAKWLRLLGYDTEYVHDIPDSELVELAASESRIILTRDTLLIRRKRCRRYILVRSDHWREQLKQVYLEAGLNCQSILTLCAVCNQPLHPVGKRSVKSLVPPYVYDTQEKFSRCDNCSRIFWSATHVTEILGELKSVGEKC